MERSLLLNVTDAELISCGESGLSFAERDASFIESDRFSFLL